MYAESHQTEKQKKNIILLTAGFAGSIAGTACVATFNREVLMTLPTAARVICMIVTYWFIGLVPLVLTIANKDTLQSFGFSKQNIGRQIITGIIIGIVMSMLFTFLPHIAGFGAYVDNGNRYTRAWQFLFEFIYCISAVSLTEEFVYRGFIYQKFKAISGNETFAMIGSSALFGLFHIFSGNVIQVVITAFIGALLCILRLKIKNCTTLSLIMVHGIYDFMITVWAAVFL